LLPISSDFIECIKGAAFAGDDVLGGLAPDEGLWIGIVLQEVVVDLVLEIVTLEELPRRTRFAVISARKRSTRSIQDALVGVKCRLKRDVSPDRPAPWRLVGRGEADVAWFLALMM